MKGLFDGDGRMAGLGIEIHLCHDPISIEGLPEIVKLVPETLRVLGAVQIELIAVRGDKGSQEHIPGH